MEIEVTFPLLLLAPRSALRASRHGELEFISTELWHTVEWGDRQHLCIFSDTAAARQFCRWHRIPPADVLPLYASADRLLGILRRDDLPMVILNCGSEQQWVQNTATLSACLLESPRSCYFSASCRVVRSH